MTGTFVVWADQIGSDATSIEVLSYEGDPVTAPAIEAGAFVVIEDKHQKAKWFGQVIEPQRNLALQGLTRDNPSNIAAMERVLSGEVEASIFLRQVYYYCIRLIGEVDQKINRLKSVARRPRAGASGRAATVSEVVSYMDLPAFRDPSRQAMSSVGRFYGVNIPIPVNDRLLNHHFLVAGATGSGKSNSVANIIRVAQEYRYCVVIFDHKPDYQDVHKPNDEINLFDRFGSLGFSPVGLENTEYYSLFNPSDDANVGHPETQITVAAGAFQPYMLAAALFYQSTEVLQREAFLTLALSFADTRTDRNWTIKEFLGWERALTDAQRNNVFSQSPPLSGVLDAMRRRLNSRVPRWMDAAVQKTSNRSQTFSNKGSNGTTVPPSGYFNPATSLRPGHIIVVRVNTGGREYGLFLTYMLKEIFELRRNQSVSFPIFNVIDEAQDIFQDGGSIRDAAAGAINEVLRKGRSKQVGFLFAAQNADQLPDTILNNLNSRIIHRQNTPDELRSAIPGAPRELLQLALTFGPGEALVSLLGTRAVIHAELAPAPFMLTKEQVASSATLADQMGIAIEESNDPHENVQDDWHRDDGDNNDDIPF
jgi:hypothetical protein